MHQTRQTYPSVAVKTPLHGNWNLPIRTNFPCLCQGLFVDVICPSFWLAIGPWVRPKRFLVVLEVCIRVVNTLPSVPAVVHTGFRGGVKKAFSLLYTNQGYRRKFPHYEIPFPSHVATDAFVRPAVWAERRFGRAKHLPGTHRVCDTYWAPPTHIFSPFDPPFPAWVPAGCRIGVSLGADSQRLAYKACCLLSLPRRK